MKFALAVLICFMTIIFSFSQNTKVKFGVVTPEDLAMKVYTPDTEAVAVILAKTGYIEYDPLAGAYPLTEEKHYIIKILKEAGINKYGNVEINYYSYNKRTDVSGIKAMVHLPDGTEIKISNDQVFDEKKSEFWSSKKFAFPKLITGAVIEYQYTIHSYDRFHPVDWFFQAEIPIVYAELETKIPETYDYVVLTQGTLVDKKEDGAKPGPAGIKKQGIKVYINEDVPALKKESYITTMEDYYTRIRYQLQSVQYPGSHREQILDTWDKLAQGLYEIPEWGGQFKNKRPGELVLKAANITPGTDTSQMETAQKLYDYINQNFQWNGKYNISTQKDIVAILKAMSGSSGDLNKLMCAALQQSGIVAKPVLISTRDHGKPLELYPFTDQFNHMAVLATIDEKDYWLDMGDKNLPLGALRKNALNTRGWIADEKNPSWTDIVPVNSKSVFVIKGSLDENGNLNGAIETRFTGYHAMDKRNMLDEKKEFGDHLMVSGSSPIKVSGLEIIHANDVSQPLQIKANVVDQSIGTATPDKIYLNPIFPEGLDEIPFRLEKRTYPIEMNYPSEVSMMLNVALPEGYTIESLPSPIRFANSTGGIHVIYDAALVADKLNITIKYVVKQTYFEPEEYTTLKSIFNKRKEKFNEQIVLTKTK
ncbi:MAG TPA: DUF3857 domain-containing protein [Saprospiraceae bacterium]|nr:DUF3857 domain-containing protein [Saprospiraceae bacterium]